MNEDRRREIGLFRYTLIRDAADEGLSKAGATDVSVGGVSG